MTVSDIGKILSVVAITQLVADLLAKKYVFQSESYLRSVSSFERAKARRDKTAASIAAKQLDPKKSSKSTEKDQKKLQRENEELSTIAAEVARRHTVAGFYTSIVFLLLYKILSAEYAGRIVGVLPFEPFKLLQRMTFMSLGGPGKLSVGEVQTLWLESMGGPAATVPGAEISFPPDVQDVSQACAFAFIYMLCSLSVKMMINMAFGTKPPKGADEGMSTFMDSPQSQKMFKSFGLDVNEVKEARSTLGF